VLQHLTDVLVDAEKSVRIEAVRAITRVSRQEGGLLLRLRALTGDSEPEVLGAVFSGLLELDRKEGIPFVVRFFDRDAEAAVEAAVALGLTHDPEAYRVLNDRLSTEPDPTIRGGLLRGMALTRLPEATDALIEMIRSGSRDARAAMEALSYVALRDDIRNGLAEAVRDSSDQQIRRLFEKHFAG
jgi:HEAT repeat protein